MIDIMLDNDVVGKAATEKQGLYYRFICRCRFDGEQMYRLIASCDNKEVDLGLCIPCQGGFGLEKKVPIKKLGNGNIRIRAVPRYKKEDKTFIPLDRETPFSHLDRLDTAFLETRDGVIGIVIPQGSDKQGNDQSL